jgi:hypothetical protein
LLVGPRAERHQRFRMSALAAFLAAAIVAPYLVSCAIATGDPLYAVNYHTGYYRYGEGLPWQQPMSATEYVRGKLAARPLATIDVATTGVFVQPFATKWRGLDPWLPGMATALRWTSIAGLFMLVFSPAGRLLLVILVTSLLPYAVTWNVAGGGEWRFTMHVYPFFIVAAFYAIHRVWSAAAFSLRGKREAGSGKREAGSGKREAGSGKPGGWNSTLRRVPLAFAVVANLVAAYLLLPPLVVREANALGDDVNLEAGGRDIAFLGDGWTVINRRLLAIVRLGWTADRMGAYRLHLPESDVAVGRNELTLVPDAMVSAGSLGPRFEWLNPQTQIGVRLWYVRVLGP